MAGFTPPIVNRFMLPQQAAITRSGSVFASAPKSVSVIRCEVLMLALDTAAGKFGLTMLPSGVMSIDKKVAKITNQKNRIKRQF